MNEDQFPTGQPKDRAREVLAGLYLVNECSQVNSRILENMHLIVERRYEGSDFNEKLAAATRPERGIYEAVRLLNEKLNVAKFLLRPEWLKVASDCVPFGVQGLILKYVRICQPLFDSRSIAVRLTGESHGQVVASPGACGVVPHTLLDYATKHAPSESSVEIHLEDREDGAVHLNVSSFGPRLTPKEDRAVFRPFDSESAAVQGADEEAACGLYVSQLIAKEHLGTELEVAQDHTRTHGHLSWTTFRIVFPARALVA